MNKLKDEGLIGGVSPLKQRGEHATAATVTAKQRGGFSTPTGTRGAGGKNVGGYNVNTRFKPSGAWSKPGSGGIFTTPEKKKKEEKEKPQNPKKPYSYTPEGELKINDPTSKKKSGYWKKWTTEHEYDESTSYDYRSVWDRNDKDFQKKWKDQEQDGDGGYAAWEKSAKKWNKENPGEAKKRQSKNKGKYTKHHKEWVEGEEDTQSQDEEEEEEEEEK